MIWCAFDVESYSYSSNSFDIQRRSRDFEYGPNLVRKSWLNTPKEMLFIQAFYMCQTHQDNAESWGAEIQLLLTVIQTHVTVAALTKPLTVSGLQHGSWGTS